jgi:hypothetical protein
VPNEREGHRSGEGLRREPLLLEKSQCSRHGLLARLRAQGGPWQPHVSNQQPKPTETASALSVVAHRSPGI